MDLPASQAGVPGLHLIGDLHECACDAMRLLDCAFLQQHCLACVYAAGLTVVGQCFHQFGELGGVTGVVVLAESHLAIHTWPEKNFVTLDVYVCNYSGDNREKAEKLFSELTVLFSPGKSSVQRVERG